MEGGWPALDDRPSRGPSPADACVPLGGVCGVQGHCGQKAACRGTGAAAVRVRRLEPNPREPMKKSSKGKSCFPSLVQGPKAGLHRPMGRIWQKESINQPLAAGATSVGARQV